MGWVAEPREDRWHANTTALMGGIAIYAGATIGLLATAPVSAIWPIWLGATIMFATGLVDDLRQIAPAAKLAMQIVATSLLLYAGYAFGHDWPLWLSLPLTLVWVVGVTNAVNLLDNMDGLSAGIAGIAAASMVAFAAMSGSPLAVAIGTPVVGAAAGFLIYNFKPASIFMGDCGSLFLGFLVAALGLVIQQEAAVAGPLAVALVPLAVLAVPIFDTTLVTFVRKLSGRAVSQGGRDHSSHRLVFLGLSERHAVLMLYGISLFAGSAVLAVLYVDVKLFLAVTTFVFVALTVFGVHLARANVYGETAPDARQGRRAFQRSDAGDGEAARSDEALASGDGARPEPREYSRRYPNDGGEPVDGFQPLLALHNLLGYHWKALFGVAADALLVGAAFVASHFLRFESGVPAAHETQLLEVLALVVALKVTVFYAMGLYRGIWRYAGTPELVRTALATLAASLGTFALLATMYGLDQVSRGVLVIDWMMVTLAVIGVRFGFRGLRQYLASKREGGRSVLLYGAGDGGVLAVRELRQNDTLNMMPVGFIDDDPLKQGHTVQGLKVLGTGDDLKDVAECHDVDEVIVTTMLTEQRRRRLIQQCRNAGLTCRSFGVGLHTLVRSSSPAPEVTVHS
jgi:UDP-GlcNAc:undecaprenyl-phosphate GlcNAc-1-phosphate transferase